MQSNLHCLCIALNKTGQILNMQLPKTLCVMYSWDYRKVSSCWPWLEKEITKWGVLKGMANVFHWKPVRKLGSHAMTEEIEIIIKYCRKVCPLYQFRYCKLYASVFWNLEFALLLCFQAWWVKQDVSCSKKNTLIASCQLYNPITLKKITSFLDNITLLRVHSSHAFSVNVPYLCTRKKGCWKIHIVVSHKGCTVRNLESHWIHVHQRAVVGFCLGY